MTNTNITMSTPPPTTQGTTKQIESTPSAQSTTMLELLLDNAALGLIADVGGTVLLAKTPPSNLKLFTTFAISTVTYILRDIAKMYGHSYEAALVCGGFKSYWLDNNAYIGVVTTPMYTYSDLALPLTLNIASPMVIETVGEVLKGTSLSKEVFIGSTVITGLVALYAAVSHSAKYLSKVTVEEVKVSLTPNSIKDDVLEVTKALVQYPYCETFCPDGN